MLRFKRAIALENWSRLALSFLLYACFPRALSLLLTVLGLRKRRHDSSVLNTFWRRAF